MRLTTFDNLAIPAGTVHHWTAIGSGEATAHTAGPSENERFHLDAVSGGSTGWLAVTVDIDTPTLDLDRMRQAFTDVLDHHEVLRAHFEEDADGMRRMLHPPGHLTVTSAVTHTDMDAQGCKQLLADAIDEACTAMEAASHVLVAVERPGRTTAICAFDHCYVDAHSLAVVAEVLVAAYLGTALPPAGSFLDHQRESMDGLDIAPSDPRVVAWGDFLRRTEWSVPEFPLDLGVPEGEFAPAAIHVDTVMSADDATAFSAEAAQRGIRFYPALLACLAAVTRGLGGPERLPLVLPVHTRHDESWRRSVGWFVANAPMVLDATGSGDDAMRDATDALSAALPLAEVDLTTVYKTFGHLLRKPRHDVFMVSYLDYRRFRALPDMNVQHVSSDGRADTLQLWFWRDESGVHLRTRYPDTPRARMVVTTLVAELIAMVTDRMVSGADSSALIGQS